MIRVKEAYYFSHDSNARNDEKVLMLRADHGWEGYGIYWALVEMMFENTETALSHSKVKGIAISYNIDITLLKGVINTCISEGLFDSDEHTFWSESLRRRKAYYHESKMKKSEAGKKGMAKRWGSKEITEGEIYQSNNTVITKNNKRKEKKVKEIYNDTPSKELYMDFVYLTSEEYEKLTANLGSSQRDYFIDKLNVYIGQIGVAEANKKYKSHYFTILNWQRREVKEKPKPTGTDNWRGSDTRL